jgi:hypothetical protein
VLEEHQAPDVAAVMSLGSIPAGYTLVAERTLVSMLECAGYGGRVNHYMRDRGDGTWRTMDGGQPGAFAIPEAMLRALEADCRARTGEGSAMGPGAMLAFAAVGAVGIWYFTRK